MEEKSIKFVKSLARTLSSHLTDFSTEQLQIVLENAISSLPDKSEKLKSHLNRSLVDYTKKFYSYINEKKDVIELSALSSNDLLSQDILYHASDELKVMLERAKQIKCASYVKLCSNAWNWSCKIKQKIFEEAFHACPDMHSKIILCKKLSVLAISCNSSAITHCVVNSLYRNFDEEIEEFSKSDKRISLVDLKKSILNSIITLQVNRNFDQIGSESSNLKLPSMSHLVVGIFSLFIDATLLESSNSSEKDNEALGYKLIEQGLIILDNQLEKLLESLVQITASAQLHADVILKPLYEYVLLKSHWSIAPFSEQKFLQYVLAIRQAALLLEGKYKHFTKNIYSASLKILAPEYFFEWCLKQKGGADLLDITPLFATTSPRAVTKYFIKECEMETLEEFVDLTIAGPEVDLSKSDSDDEINKTAIPENAFFIDNKASIIDESTLRSTNKVVANANDKSKEDEDMDYFLENGFFMDSKPTSVDGNALRTTKEAVSDVNEKCSEDENVDNFLDDLPLPDYSPTARESDRENDTIDREITADESQHVKTPEKSLQTDIDCSTVTTDADSETTAHVAKTPVSGRKQRRTSRNTRSMKTLGHIDPTVVLSPIVEDELHSSKVTKNKSVIAVTRKLRSDSESSTAANDDASVEKKLPSDADCNADTKKSEFETTSPVTKTPVSIGKRKRITRATGSVKKLKDFDPTLSLSPIVEDELHSSKVTKHKKSVIAVTRKLRSDSESSTGSNGYMTRSRRRSILSGESESEDDVMNL